MKKPTSIKDILENIKVGLKEYDIEISSNHGNQDDEELFNEIIRQQITELLEQIEKEIINSKCAVPPKPKIEGWLVSEMNNIILYVGRINYNKALKDIKQILNNLKK